MDRVMSWRRDGATIAGGIAAALGKGLLIACAGFTVAAVFGGPAAAAATLWSILATGLFGSTCLLGAAMIRRERCDAEDAVKEELRELVSLIRKLPGVEGQMHEPDSPCGPYTARLEGARKRSSLGRGR
jgi:hypothetical protein